METHLPRALENTWPHRRGHVPRQRFDEPKSLEPPWLLPLLGLLDEPGLLVELGVDGELLLEGEPLMRSDDSSKLSSSRLRSMRELSDEPDVPDVPEPLLDLSPKPRPLELEPFEPW